MHFAPVLGICVTNIICNVLFGYRYLPGEKEEEFQQLQEFTYILANLAFDTDPINHLSWIKYIYHTKDFKRYLKSVHARDEFIGNQITKHLTSFCQDRPRDFTDRLISDKQVKLNCPGIDASNRNEIEMILSDMLLAGIDTTRSMLEWSVLFLLHWPYLQDLIYKEIVDLVGKGNYPPFKQKEKFHIYNAFISESLRYSSFAPTLGIHKALKNENIGSYKIPGGTSIIYNAWKIHHDKKHWNKPFKFDHTRWLDANNEYQTNKSFVPFGLGVRSCPGEALSYKEIFVFLTRLICDFKILPEGNKPLPDLEGCHGNLIVTKPYYITIEERE